MDSRRNLLLICYIVCICLTTTNGDCEDIPTDCAWNDQQKCYKCDIIGTQSPSKIVIRKLRLSHFIKDITKVHSLHITTPPEMNNTVVSWNKENITLFLKKDFRPSGRYNLSINIYTKVCAISLLRLEIIKPNNKQIIPIVMRSLDVKLENLTSLNLHGNNKNVTFRCTITGLDPDETANEIEFGHLPKCDHNQLKTNEINIQYLNYTLSNGTIGELHIPNANASHNGDYHCRVKIHTQPRNECMLVKTPVKTVDIEDDIQDPVPPPDSDTTVENHIDIIGIIVITITSVFTVLLIILVAFNIVKMRKRKQQVHNQPELEQSVHNQPELEQSVEVEEHVQEHLPLLQISGSHELQRSYGSNDSGGSLELQGSHRSGGSQQSRESNKTSSGDSGHPIDANHPGHSAV